MSDQLRARLYEALDGIWLVDPHTHIDPRSPASTSLADVLGYHYYTELAHSAGMPRERIEEPGLSPRERVARLMEWWPRYDNTIQAGWLVEMAQRLFDFGEEQIRRDNWEPIFDRAGECMADPGWADFVLSASKLEAVFLTNDFDDPLTGFDTKKYIPCLRTDDLVFHLGRPEVRERLERSTGVSVNGAAALRTAIGKLFDHFTGHGARACAVSLPPDFSPRNVEEHAAGDALGMVITQRAGTDVESRQTLSAFVFWTLAEMCAEHRLPFDLMIGVNRNVYEAGVFQGRDLYDSRVSLIQYAGLFNAFPQVTFPVSVLASVTNQELVSYAWIFPNVVTHGHWWYSNTPTYIEHDASARLEAVPASKQIAYYSDMYKLEFAVPKFGMYKRVLAKILAERFVIDRSWDEHRALELGRQVLRGNVDRVFGLGGVQ